MVESWDALDDDNEEGENAADDKPTGQVNGDVKKPKRRSLAQIKAEKEAQKIKDEEERARRAEEMKTAPPQLTAAQLQRIQEDADLELCKDTFGNNFTYICTN